MNNENIVPFDQLNFANPEKHALAQEIGRQFDKLHSRFLEDIEELINKMGGDEFLKITVNSGRLADVHLLFKY